MDSRAEIRNIKSLFDFFRDELAVYYDIKEVNSMLYVLFEEYLQKKKVDIYISPDDLISGLQYDKIYRSVEELKRYKPLQYITGSAYFFGMKFFVSPGILIPRPETEELVRWVIDENKDREQDILDVGSSSGCVAICLDKYIPEAKVTGIDIDEGALEVARKNNKLHKTDAKFFFFDILDEAGWTQFPRYDIIVSNPPYVRESEKRLMRKNVLEYEPPEALFVKDDNPLVFYKAIMKFAQAHLKPAGKIYFEINEAFGEEMKRLMEDFGFNEIALRKDINEKDRMISGVFPP